MDSSWQSLAIIPLVIGALIYMARFFKRNRQPDRPPCAGCNPDEAACNCPLAKGKGESPKGERLVRP